MSSTYCGEACTILLLGISSALSGYKIWLKMTSLFTMVALLLCAQWSHIFLRLHFYFYMPRIEFNVVVFCFFVFSNLFFFVHLSISTWVEKAMRAQCSRMATEIRKRHIFEFWIFFCSSLKFTSEILIIHPKKVFATIYCCFAAPLKLHHFACFATFCYSYVVT